jgi:hypothetical protein
VGIKVHSRAILAFIWDEGWWPASRASHFIPDCSWIERWVRTGERVNFVKTITSLSSIRKLDPETLTSNLQPSLHYWWEKHTHTHTKKHTHTNTPTNTPTNIHTHTHTRAQTHTHTKTHIHTHTPTQRHIHTQIHILGRSQWWRGLRHELSSPAPTLRSWVRILLEAGMFVCVYSVCVVLCVGSGLAAGWSPVKGVLRTVY